MHLCQNVDVTDGFIEIIRKLMKKEINLEGAFVELVPIETESAAL